MNRARLSFFAIFIVRDAAIEPTAAQLQRLNQCSAIELGFPLDFLSSEAVHGAFGNSLEMIADRGRHFGNAKR